NNQHSELFDNKTSCFFTKDYHLFAHDLAETISLPAIDQTMLNEKIQECFHHLLQQEGTHPILVGAIPFDTTQPSSLNFYRQHRKQESTSADSTAAYALSSLQLKNKKQVVEGPHFSKVVASAIEEFSTNRLEKIVLSQAADFELLDAQQPAALANTLFAQNPHAYTFVVPVDQDRYLLGASPELLISKHNMAVRSNPLAGSRPRSEDAATNALRTRELQASHKDLHEHKFVVDSILQNLAPLCQELNVSEQPEILETTTMLHLSSVFQGRLKDQNLNALDVALSLHPTPAVCGSPTQLAKQFILQHEGYDREYYAGLVGWMDAHGNGEWVVTIRCGLLSPKNIRLYAGAGIVTGSEADLEWNETEAKMQTMLKTLNASIDATSI
ncbi:MAG: isochorismate synthase, partial [Acinetobacter sp.]